ncbi:leucine-rich repeat transmembrane neuronal protein 3-like isoform X2 [Mytilus edulis]|uniref:leucine-rich repeat transmembrane neuronal protein 3-like isoform X2 n=1 Tax=Mytilus edulis TaxID=6550 RepID=UPI0039F0B15D
MRHTFFLIVCSVMLSTVFGCSTPCYCHGSKYYCSYKSLTTVPSGIPNTTTLLELKENQITEIKVDEFQGMAALENLYLDNNLITKLVPNVFQDLTALKTLYLYSNLITNLVPNVFQDLTALTKLDLNTNQITEIKVDAFQGMAALEKLYLYGNRITNLVLNVFQDLTALKILYLDGNLITNLVPNVFQHLTALKTLLLDQNPLNCGNCEMSQLKLFLQNQNLGTAGATCIGTSIKVVTFDFTNCTATETSTLYTTNSNVGSSSDTFPATETNTLNTTKSNVGSTSEADSIAIITGAVTGAVVVLCVIAFFVIRKVCSCASNVKTVVHPSI